MAACIFCRIAAGAIEATKVHEDDLVVVIEDLNPQAPLHVLVVPKKHFNSVRDVDDPLLMGHMFTVANHVADTRHVASTGYRLVINCGREGGQTVNHLHLHLLGGRQMSWPPG